MLMMSHQQHLQPGQRQPDHHAVAGHRAWAATTSTADRGERGRARSKPATGMVFHSPARGASARLASKKLGVHARRSRSGLPIDEAGHHARSRTRRATTRRGARRASRTGWSRTTVGRVHLQRHPHPEMPFYDLPLASKHLSRDHRRLLPDPRPPRDDRPARPHEGLGFRESTRVGPVVRHRRPAHARTTRTRSSTRPRRRSTRSTSSIERGHHHRAGAVQQGHRPWTHAREQITKTLMRTWRTTAARTDDRQGECRTSTRSS